MDRRERSGGDRRMDADTSFDNIDDEYDDEPPRLRRPVSPPQQQQQQLTYTNAYVDRYDQRQPQQQPPRQNSSTRRPSYQPQTDYLNIIDEETRTDTRDENEVNWRRQQQQQTTTSPRRPSQNFVNDSYQNAAPVPINRLPNDERDGRSPPPPPNNYQRNSGHRRTSRDDYNQYIEDPNDMRVYR